jgi:hypothetical protein
MIRIVSFLPLLLLAPFTIIEIFGVEFVQVLLLLTQDCLSCIIEN